MEFFVTHQAVDHYSGDCSVAFALKDKSNDNRIIQNYLDLHRFEPKLGNTLLLGKVEGYKSKRVLVVGLGETPLTQKNFTKALKSLSSAMSTSKVKNVVIPSVEVESADEAWIQTTTARVLKNESYKVNKVGVKEDESGIVLEAVNIFSKNNGASEIQKGVSKENVKKEILAGRSISLCFPKHKVYSSALVGGSIPIAVGTAMSLKIKKEKNTMVYCFMGEMTSETGIAHECIKYSRNFNLPIHFIVEDNEKSVCTDTRKTWMQKKLSYEGANDKFVTFYSYKSKWPHAGAGKRIQF